jgi:tetratricopeptide (TPR) repeat protein
MACRIVDLQDLAYGFLDPEAEFRVREHLAGCGRCRADLARLEGEKELLAGAAARARAPRERRALVPLAFAAALVLGLVWLMKPGDPAPFETVLVPAAQDKGKGAKELPDTEEALKAEIARLQTALARTPDEQEKHRIETSIGDLQVRLDRLAVRKESQAAMKEKSENPKKPLAKPKPEAGDDERAMKLRMEAKETAEKIKLTQDPGERKRLESRMREIERELKTGEPVRAPINLKEVELRLQSNPDDVAALVDRATGHLDNGKAEAAMKDLDRAISLRPDFAPAYLKRAIAHAMLGRQPQAWQDAKRGEELDMKAGKMIDETYRTIKKLTGNAKERRITPADLENQAAGLRERLEELRSMAENGDLSSADRDRARRDAERVRVEIERLSAEIKSMPAEPEKKVEKKK